MLKSDRGQRALHSVHEAIDELRDIDKKSTAKREGVYAQLRACEVLADQIDAILASDGDSTND